MNNLETHLDNQIEYIIQKLQKIHPPHITNSKEIPDLLRNFSYQFKQSIGIEE